MAPWSLPGCPNWPPLEPSLALSKWLSLGSRPGCPNWLCKPARMAPNGYFERFRACLEWNLPGCPNGSPEHANGLSKRFLGACALPGSQRTYFSWPFRTDGRPIYLLSRQFCCRSNRLQANLVLCLHAPVLVTTSGQFFEAAKLTGGPSRTRKP